MSFAASELKQAMAAPLGTFGTQRYLDVPHYIPAIQAGMRRFKALVGSVFAENKGGEELFSEITETKVFQTSQYGNIKFSSGGLGHSIWSIVAIYPEPTTRPTANIIPSPPEVRVTGSLLAMRSLLRVRAEATDITCEADRGRTWRLL